MTETKDDVPLSELRKSPSHHGYSPLSSDAGVSEEEAEANHDAAQKQQESDGKSSSHYTLMVIIRTFVGTGIMAMPYAFKNLGLILGFGGILFCWIVMTYSLYILVESAANIEQKCGKKELGYGEVMGEAASLGPKCFQRCTTGFRNLVNGLILLMQFGCCCVYIVFIADNIKAVVNEEFDLTWSNKRYICILAPIFVLLSIIRNINILAKFSVFGNLVFLAGFVIILQYVAHDFIPLNKLAWVEKPSAWARGFSTAVFAFEGICLVLPLRNKMRKQEDYMGCNGVLMTSMYLVLILYLCLGFYGFLRFGSSVHASISLDLPHEPLYSALKILFSLVIFCSYAVQFFPIIDILFLDPDHGLAKKVEQRGRSTNVWEYVFRISCSLLTIIFALTIPMLGSLMEFVGAVLGISLSITLPNTIVLLVRYSDQKLGRCYWRIPFHGFFILFGLLMAVVGAITTVQDIVHAYGDPSEMRFDEILPTSSTV